MAKVILQFRVMAKSSVKPISVFKWERQTQIQTADVVVTEEPLEIRINHRMVSGERAEQSLSVTMRTPGNDLELALGFLFSEGIIDHYSEIKNIRHCLTVEKEEEKGNVVKVTLTDDKVLDDETFSRNFYMTSSCGVCGKSSIDAVQTTCQQIQSNMAVPASQLVHYPDLLRKAQTVFEHTGGIHAAALFDQQHQLVILREDVGRHNALDKVIGSMLFEKKIPLDQHVLLVSGRTSFELLQKTARAGISIILAVGAPSSLAVELAENLGITLVGFLKRERFNVYTHPNRIIF